MEAIFEIKIEENYRLNVLYVIKHSDKTRRLK